MKYRIILSPDANADIGSAVLWYQRINPNLAFRFLSETDKTIRLIRQYPLSFPLVTGVIRRAVLHRFRYSIYFSLKNDEVSVIAVLHQRQSYMRRISGRNGTG
jgi:plasmid stabilization system protein ParE